MDEIDYEKQLKTRIKTIQSDIAENEIYINTYKKIIEIIKKEQRVCIKKIDKLQDRKRDLEDWYGYGKKYKNAESKIEELEKINECFYTVIKEIEKINKNFYLSTEDKQNELKFLLGE